MTSYFTRISRKHRKRNAVENRVEGGPLNHAKPPQNTPNHSKNHPQDTPNHPKTIFIIYITGKYGGGSGSRGGGTGSFNMRGVGGLFYFEYGKVYQVISLCKIAGKHCGVPIYRFITLPCFI